MPSRVNPADVVATPGLSECQPCHVGSDSSSLKSCSALWPASCLPHTQRRSAGITTRLERPSSSSGLPDGACKIGLSAGLPSAWRNSARISASVGVSGTGLAAFSVFWCCREFVPNRLTHAQALAVEILPASAAGARLGAPARVLDVSVSPVTRSGDSPS
jgi:hypothetical protein